MRTIGFRLGLLVFGCLLIAFAAGAGVIYTLHVTDRTVDRALDAQRRLDMLTEMSGRIQQYGLVAISTVADPKGGAVRLKEAETAVDAGIQAFQPEIAKAISEADLPPDVSAMAARSRPLENVRAGFHVLVRQVEEALAQPDASARGDSIRGAFNSFATFTGPNLFFLMQADRRGVEAGRDDERAVSTTLTRAALALVVLALVGALVLHRLTSRPILAAVAEIRDAAIAIGQGERNLRLPVRNRDELGLLAAVFNRMTARLRRGERRVAADRLALETTIADRTADLRAANDRLSEIDRSRRRFFADVSHELRTPLTVILGECEIAMRPPSSAADASERRPGEDQAAFGVIRRRAQRLQRRVEDMLRVARSESGTIELHFAPVALQAVCAGAIEAFEGATRRKDVDIKLEPAAAEVLVEGDFEWLRQIVEGMIDNALRHATGGKLVSLACATAGGAATLAVRDDGPGFGVADPRELLERFARRGAAPSVAGHGIGLALVRWVVDKHHGDVTLGQAPPPLNGAEILIRLPPGETLMAEAEILVVEDDADIGALLNRGLGSAGFAVTWVDTAGGAVAHMSGHVPSAVLLDVMLPDGTGYDLCRALRQNGFHGPILFLSAKDEVSDRVDGLAAGGDDYIVKPFSFDELVARLRAQLMRRAAVGAEPDLPQVGGMTLDADTRQVRFRDMVAKLTQREAELLGLFMDSPNKPVSRGDIFDRLWLDQGSASLNVVDVYIGYLRGKLGDIARAGGPAISTVRGRGFMLEVPR